MKAAIFTLVFAILIALIDSSPLPQGAPAPGGEKKIVVVGPGAGPWSIGSSQVCTWWSTGFTADEPVTVTTLAEGSTTPISSADSTLNAGSTQIPITDQYKPGTNYVTEVSLKSDPTVKGVGPTFTVTGGGGGPPPAGAPKEAGGPKEVPKEAGGPKEAPKEAGGPKEASKGPPPDAKGPGGQPPSGPDAKGPGGQPPSGPEASGPGGQPPSGPEAPGPGGPPPPGPGGPPPPGPGGPPPPGPGGPPPSGPGSDGGPPTGAPPA